MKKFIVPLDVVMHVSFNVVAEDKTEALQMALNMVESEEIDWNDFDHYVCQDTSPDDIGELKDDMAIHMLAPNYPVRHMFEPNGSGCINVGPESVDSEDSEHDCEYYCYVPDGLFWRASDDELQEFINKYFD